MNYSYNYINVPSTECRIQSFGKRNCNSNSFYTEQESSSFILCYIKPKNESIKYFLLSSTFIAILILDIHYLCYYYLL